MTDTKMTCTVKADYYDLAETTNPIVIAQILVLIAADQIQNPKSAEQLRIEQFQAEAEDAKAAKQTATWAKERAEKELKELKEKVDTLTGKDL